MNNRGNILWVDDEIEHLKPHLLFLREKGFEIETASNGIDGVQIAKTKHIDLALLDQFMPGMDGLDTLRKLKKIDSSLPVIMVTKSEEEALMNEAISEKISQFLIKPVNTSQVFIAIKQVLESAKIQDEKTTKDFLKEYQDLTSRKKSNFTIDDWWQVYKHLAQWQLELDQHKEVELLPILWEEFNSCNREFSRFIENIYPKWLQSDSRPLLSADVVKNIVIPELKQDKQICFLVMDCLRLDQFLAMKHILSKDFSMELSYHVSMLPSATPYSRNALFSGMFFDDLVSEYPQQLAVMSSGERGLNQFEEMYLKHLLERENLQNIGTSYHKILSAKQGLKFKNKIGDFLDQNLISVVVNFVDQLAHKQSESSVLREMVSDESAFCKAVVSWFENSWLHDVLRYLRDHNFSVILTSDHGSISVKKGVVVKADKEASTGVRYKVGRNLNCDEKFCIKVRKPSEYKLVEMGHQTTYIFARDSVFFLYPNQFNQYHGVLQNSFQHGGISLEELLVPVATLRGK